MQFVVIARMRDPSDPDAQRRRLEAREAHIAGATKLAAEGKLLIGGSAFTDDGQPLGSVAVANFETREELEAWLRSDPYVVNDVWHDIEVLRYEVSPVYLKGRTL